MESNGERNLKISYYHESNAKYRNLSNENNYQRLALSIKSLKSLTLN